MTALDINEEDIYDGGHWPDAYIDDLAALTKLTHLSVSHSALDYLRLAAAIGPLTRLTDLKIEWGTLTPAAAFVLAPTLERLTGLRSLSLFRTSPPPKSVAALADALVRLPGLEELCIMDNEDGTIGSDGAAELARALEAMVDKRRHVVGMFGGCTTPIPKKYMPPASSPPASDCSRKANSAELSEPELVRGHGAIPRIRL
jgi:hypothetical protein